MSALLENLPEDWEISTLGALNSRKAPTINPKAFADETFEYYSIPDYQRDQRPSLAKGAAIESSKLLLKPKSVLFGRLNPRVEKVWRVAESRECRQIGSTEWIAILPTERVDADFLYFLEWSEHVMPIAKTLVSGSTPSRQRVDPTSFYRLEVPLPPLPEQKKIAYILSTVQRAIEAQERIIHTTNELKKALMHKLFTEGLRNEPQKQTEIGPVPESWEVVELGRHCRVQSGFAFRSVDYVKGNAGIPITKIGDIQNGRVFYTEKSSFVPEKFWDDRRLAPFKLQFGDVLIALTGATTGKSGIFQHYQRAFLNQRVGRFLPDDSGLKRSFLPFVVQQPHFLAEISSNILVAAQGNISPKRIEQIKIGLPAPDVQEEVASLLYSIDRKIVCSQAMRNALQDLFRTLLQVLMTAKTRVDQQVA